MAGLNGFFPVIIKDPKGNTKKVVPPEELSEKYWETFDDNSGLGGREKPTPRETAKRLATEHNADTLCRDFDL